jgi:ubiquinone/menaquinone biosynthesis C-methylase UbiE
MHNHMARLAIGGKLHTAPIGDNPQRILDVGCGTGIWTIDIGMLSNRRGGALLMDSF